MPRGGAATLIFVRCGAKVRPRWGSGATKIDDAVRVRTLRAQKCGVRTERSAKKAQASLTGCGKPVRDALA